MSTITTSLAAQRGQSANRREPDAGATAPKYFALIIGNNKYQHLKPLNTAINDAVVLGRVLRELYGFQTRLLTDVGREQIMDALNEYRKILDRQSYLLIYYVEGKMLFIMDLDPAQVKEGDRLYVRRPKQIRDSKTGRIITTSVKIGEVEIMEVQSNIMIGTFSGAATPLADDIVTNK
jgi:hypothetical protein